MITPQAQANRDVESLETVFPICNLNIMLNYTVSHLPQSFLIKTLCTAVSWQYQLKVIEYQA